MIADTPSSTVEEAIERAESLLPGQAIEDGPDPRWRAIIAVGEFLESAPEESWPFLVRWGSHPDEDVRNAIATCLLEHLLEYHFDTYFLKVEALATNVPLFGDTFLRCWALGQAAEADNAEHFANLTQRIVAMHNSVHFEARVPMGKTS